MTPFDRSSSGWASGIEFGTASGFGLPPLPGGDTRVMHLAALDPDQGLEVAHHTPVNGLYPDKTSRYTLIVDVFYPQSARERWRAIYQADPTNSNDGEMFVQNTAKAGLGINGVFNGSVPTGEWHRIVIVVRSGDGEGTLQKFVDGTFVGGQGTTGRPIDARFALAPTFLLFTDDNGETAESYVAGVAVVGEAMTFDEVLALGGPTAAGPHVAGAPGAPWPWSYPRHVDAIGHRGDSCCAPEDTIPSCLQAFAKGGDAVEVDIRLSSDGVAVVMHDSTVDRTTDGSGAVSSFTAAELGQLDAGSFYGPRWAGVPPPTLAEVLAAIKGKGRAYLDIKVGGMGPAIQAALDEAGVDAHAVWIWAHSPDELDYYNATVANPDILYSNNIGWDTDPGYFDALKAKGVVGFSLQYFELTPDFAAAAQAAGLYVVEVYTILDPEAMQIMIENGADAMETDYPGVLSSLTP